MKSIRVLAGALIASAGLMASASSDDVAQLRELNVILRSENAELRQRVADLELSLASVTAERDELQAFIDDRHDFGQDFERYRGVKAILEREAKRREMEAARERREAEMAARRERIDAAREAAQRTTAQSTANERYEQSGFASIGLDVWVGRMSFSYPTKSTSGAMVEYDPYLGLYYRQTGATERVDFGRMTISGSIVNAAKEIRNVGVAITFFDDAGNQVGSETIKINNARPDVPYPFTATLDMALNRPFSTSSTYVMYADPAN